MCLNKFLKVIRRRAKKLVSSKQANVGNRDGAIDFFRKLLLAEILWTKIYRNRMMSKIALGCDGQPPGSEVDFNEHAFRRLANAQTLRDLLLDQGAFPVPTDLKRVDLSFQQPAGARASTPVYVSGEVVSEEWDLSYDLRTRKIAQEIYHLAERCAYIVGAQKAAVQFREAREAEIRSLQRL